MYFISSNKYNSLQYNHVINKYDSLHFTQPICSDVINLTTQQTILELNYLFTASTLAFEV